jgi:hypothetical protein
LHQSSLEKYEPVDVKVVIQCKSKIETASSCPADVEKNAQTNPENSFA